MSATASATARAHANIALVKYWGKRDEALFLPTNGSLSLTLDRLYATTSVRFDPALAADHFTLDGVVQPETERLKVTRFLDRVRALAGSSLHATVVSRNDVPTAAGLASSASGYAALAAAATRALGLTLDDAALSRLARQGSGSACRSLLGGFVEWQRGERDDGLDSHAVAVASADHWDLRMLVTVASSGPKGVPSREGMRRTVATSPLYPGWLASARADLAAAKAAIAARDFAALGRVAEASAMTMHATTLGARPPFSYWQPATLALWQAVVAMREDGLQAYATIDAGPNVKVLCQPIDEAAVTERLLANPAVERVIACRPGPGVSYLPEGPR